MIAALQERLASILGAHADFAEITILVDTRPDFVNAMAEAIGRQDLVVVIGYAEGEQEGDGAPLPVFRERLRVAVVQHRLHTAHSAVALMEAAILAIHHQPTLPGVASPERFRVVSHRSDVDEDGLMVAECQVECLVLLRS